MIRNRRLAHIRRDESGFTLVELMTAMTIGLLIAFATLTVFEGFERGVASNSRTTDAEDNSRRDVANMVRILRDAGAPPPDPGDPPSATPATTVTRALGNDLVFLSSSWPGESATGNTLGSHVQRLCLNESTETVYFDGLRAGTAGPSDPGVDCPSAAQGWQHSAISTKVANTAALPLFRVGASPVRAVGIQLRADSTTTLVTRSLSLSSGGTLRGTLAPQLDEDDVDSGCDPDGTPGKALLSLTAEHPGLKLEAQGAVSVGPGKILFDLAAAVSGKATLTVTNAAGLQTLIFKEVPTTCP